MSVIRDLTKKISNSDCLILGSAPNPLIPDEKEYDKLICVKASGYSAKKLNIKKPDITFQSEWAFTDNLKFLSGLETSTVFHVLYESTKDAIQHTKDLYKKHNYKYDDCLFYLDRNLPAFYFNTVFNQVKNHGPMSYGVGVILILLSLNAKKIIISGIDPGSKGRMYNGNRPIVSLHEKPDIEVITLLNQEYKNIYTCDKNLAKKCNLNLIKAVNEICIK